VPRLVSLAPANDSTAPGTPNSFEQGNAYGEFSGFEVLPWSPLPWAEFQLDTGSVIRAQWGSPVPLPFRRIAARLPDFTGAGDAGKAGQGTTPLYLLLYEHGEPIPGGPRVRPPEIIDATLSAAADTWTSLRAINTRGYRYMRVFAFGVTNSAAYRLRGLTRLAEAASTRYVVWDRRGLVDAGAQRVHDAWLLPTQDVPAVEISHRRGAAGTDGRLDLLLTLYPERPDNEWHADRLRLEWQSGNIAAAGAVLHGYVKNQEWNTVAVHVRNTGANTGVLDLDGVCLGDNAADDQILNGLTHTAAVGNSNGLYAWDNNGSQNNWDAVRVRATSTLGTNELRSRIWCHTEGP